MAGSPRLWMQRLDRKSGFCGELLLALALAIMTCVGWIATLQHGQGAECPQSSGRISQLCTLYRFWISLFGIPKKINGALPSSLDCNWKRWIHSATLLPCVAVTTNNKRKWNANLSFWFWNWLSRVQCQINWIDLLGGIVRQNVLSLPFPLFVFCIFCRSFVFCIFAWKRKRGRQSVRHRVLSGSIPFPLWGATSQRDPGQWWDVSYSYRLIQIKLHNNIHLILTTETWHDMAFPMATVKYFLHVNCFHLSFWDLSFDNNGTCVHCTL